MNLDRRLLNEARSAGLYLVLTVGSGLLAGAMIVLQAHLLSLAVSQVFLEGRSPLEVRPLLLALLLVVLGRAALAWARETLALQAAGRIKALLRERLLARLLEMGPARARHERTGELVNTAVEGIEALDAYFSQYLPSLALAALVPTTILLVVFPVDLLTAVVFLLTAPLIPLFMVLIGKAAEALTRRQWEALSRMSAHFLDVLQGLSTLKALGRSADQVDSVRQVSERFRRTTMGVLRVAFLSALVLELMATISTALVAVEVGFRLLYDTISFQQAFFVLILAPEFYQPMRALGASFHAGMSGIAAARRIFELLDGDPVPQPDGENGRLGDGETPDLTLSPRPPASPSREGVDVVFQSVSFAYEQGARPALEGVCFQVGAGERLALVGPTGAGKSTVAALLLRFLEPDEGEILVDGEPLSRVPPDAWRERVSWVPQQPYLFNATVADNIRLARPGAGMEEVVHAAREAGALEFIERLPRGFDTPIGERGERLSGGQAQRIALARAFLKDAPVLILDEAASHLDVLREAELQEAIDRLARGRTVIAIAHHLGTARRADRIVVLSDGGVAEAGTHQELLARGGLYARLVTAQDGEPGGDGQRFDAAEWTSGTTPLGAGKVHAGREPSPSGALDAAPGRPGRARLSSWCVFRRLLGMLSPLKGWVALSALLGVATIGSGVGLMSTAAFLLATAALHPSVADLAVPVVGVRFFGISRAGFRYLERYVSHDLTFRLLSRWRVWFYRAIEPLAPARLMGHRSGDLLTRIVGDVETLQHFYVRVVAPPVVALISALLAGAFLAAFDPALALTLLLFLFMAGAGVPALAYRVGAGSSARETAVRARLNGELVDGIQGMADLVAFGQGRRYLERLRESNREWLALRRRASVFTGLHGAMMTGLTNLGMWAVLALGIDLVAGGSLEGVFLPVLALAALASFEAVAPLPLAFQHLGGSLEAARRLFDLVDGETRRRGDAETRGGGGSPLPLGEGQGEGCPGADPLEGEAPAEPHAGTGPAGTPTPREIEVGADARVRRPGAVDPRFRGDDGERGDDAAAGGTQSSALSPRSSPAPSLVVEGLSFRYGPGEPYALRNVSFRVPAGGRLAVVGPSGAGKSTLINLILRFWEHQEGRIALGGREIDELAEDELRDLVAVVSQRTHLFNATIRENIMIARPGTSEEQMIRASRAAQLHDFVESLPHGYDTQVGEQGLRLSGGERQRVAIARALLRDAPLLLLDEATASLDSVTERAVLGAVLSLMEGRTTLMVTHRLGLMGAVDEIVVLDGGCVVERGRERDLLQRDGAYRRMWETHRQLRSLAEPVRTS